MLLINAISGKIGTCISGPKYFLLHEIELGQAAICVERDERNPKPYIWIVGGIEELIDYVALARTKGEISDGISLLLLSALDRSKEELKTKTTSAICRLASFLGMETKELWEVLETAQVVISAPLDGVQTFVNKESRVVSNGSRQISNSP